MNRIYFEALTAVVNMQRKIRVHVFCYLPFLCSVKRGLKIASLFHAYFI